MKDYERTGVLTAHDIHMPSENCLDKGVAIIECVQEIPCNPCVDVCPFDAISMENINAPPIVDYEKCTGCAQCVAICPGLAIFVVKTEGKRGVLTLPYEFLPAPKKEEHVTIVDRKGKPIGRGMVTRVKKSDGTLVVTVETEKEVAMKGRHLKVRE